MSDTLDPATAEKVRARLREGGRIGPLLDEGRGIRRGSADRGGRTVRTVVNAAGEPPTVVKSVRLPQNIADAIADVRHPDGFTGVVRAALAEWLERHHGAEAELGDARRAVATLARLVDRLEEN